LCRTTNGGVRFRKQDSRKNRVRALKGQQEKEGSTPKKVILSPKKTLAAKGKREMIRRTRFPDKKGRQEGTFNPIGFPYGRGQKPFWNLLGKSRGSHA